MPESLTQAKIERGQAAQQYLQFVKDNPYYSKLIQELDNEIVTEQLGLDPKEKDRWSYLQAVRTSLFIPVNRVYADMEIGQRALSESEGEQPSGGIL